MPQRPAIQGVKLEPCCEIALREISEKIKAAKELRVALVASPFASIFGANPATALFSILTTDWDNLSQATKSVSSIVRNRCQMIAQLHTLDHPGGELNKFWIAMADSFS